MDAKQKSELLNDAYTKDLGGEPGTTAQLFREFFKSKNIMTPDPIRFGQSGKFFYEISQGEGFDNEDIFGVTILEDMGSGIYKHRHDLGGMKHNLNEAKNFASGTKVRAVMKATEKGA